MKPVNRKLDDAQIKGILEAERTNALGTNMSSDLSEQRILAYDYYMGDMPDMPAEEGQSSAVSTDVQDVVEGVLPIILDVLVSGDEIIQFNPHGPGDEAAAKQETDYINHVFYQDNEGFLSLYTAVKDVLLSKNCFIKWWMEDDESRSRERYKGLTEDAFAILSADNEVKVVSSEEHSEIDPITQAPMTMYDAVVERVDTHKRARVAAVPPEEIIVSKTTAGSIGDASYWAHVMRKPCADVVKMFPDKAEVIRKQPAAVPRGDNNENANRQTVQDSDETALASAGAASEMRLIEVTEHYIRLALEEDDVPRRYKIVTVGTGYEIIDIDEVTSWPIASGTSIIMPHRMFGRALADLAVDIQQIKTSLLRATLNNAYYANNQRVEVSESHASENTIDDLLNNRVGGVVRTKIPGGLNQIETQPIGHWILPVIEHMNDVREARTGVSRYNQGLDADSLNKTATGVTRIMDASEMRVKMMARVFAETVVVNLFRGVHQMLQEFSERSEVVKLSGAWVTVDPRDWKTRRHMKVTLPLGGASKQQLIGFFAQMLGVQKEVLMQQGSPNGPLVSYQNIYATVEQMVKLAGLKSVEPFFMKPPPPNPNAPPPPDPKMVEAQGKMQIAQAAQQHDAQLAQQEMQADAAHQKMKLAADMELQQVKAAAHHQREQDQLLHKQALDHVTLQHEAQLEQFKAGIEMRLKAFEAQQNAAVAKQQAASKPDE